VEVRPFHKNLACGKRGKLHVNKRCGTGQRFKAKKQQKHFREIQKTHLRKGENLKDVRCMQRNGDLESSGRKVGWAQNVKYSGENLPENGGGKALVSRGGGRFDRGEVGKQ